MAVEAEDGEVHLAVGALLEEVGQVTEIVGLAVLDDEDGVGLEHLRIEHELGNGAKVGQIVRRVGKNDIEFCAASFHKLKCVALHL